MPPDYTCGETRPASRSKRSKRSPDEAQRNPGFSYATQQPRISLRLIRVTCFISGQIDIAILSIEYLSD
jgi:NADPH-dependent 7-cyano-7-deazaguanine reductase QueF